MREEDPTIGTLFTNRNMLFVALFIFILALILLPTSPAQCALFLFLLSAFIFQYAISRHQLDGLSITRAHTPRVFEGDAVEVTLTLSSSRAFPLQLLLIEDLFLASMDLRKRHLIPLLAPHWRVRLPYTRHAERHLGLYLIGPLQARIADPLGIFYERREIPTITRLTVYPRADPLPDYRIPGRFTPPGMSFDLAPRVGQGEEILAVREYRRGDPPARIHWRTSARRGRLHTLQLNQPIQTELLVLLDMTRRGRYGLGGEATSRLAVTAAVALLTRAHEARHRMSLTYIQSEAHHMPAGSGLAHLHLLLDKLVILDPAGNADFWPLALQRAQLLHPSARAAFVATAARTPLAVADSIRLLTQRGIGVDCVIIDERAFIKIYREQEFDVTRSDEELETKLATLRHAGARVYPLSRTRQRLSAEVAEQQIEAALSRFTTAFRSGAR